MNLTGAKQIIDSALLLDFVREGILVTDTQTRVQYANSAAKKILGLSDNDLIEVKLFDLVHPDDKTKVKEYYQQLKKDSNLITLRRIKRKDSGKYIIVERNATMLDDGSTISILRDVTDRQQFEQRKDTFISIASHELRNPVNNISLYLEMAEAAIESKDLKKAGQMLQKITPQVERVNNLIGDMLDISKIQRGKLEFRMADFNLGDVVRDAAQEVIGSAKRKFHIDIRGKINHPVYGDRDRIHQVVTNLLSNAIKYSPNAEVIIINLAENANISVGVKDFGIGIKPEEQAHIFDRFYQVPGSNKYASGMGIGLFLSREIIRKHGGELTVKSELGEGSTFTFTLPARRPK